MRSWTHRFDQAPSIFLGFTCIWAINRFHAWFITTSSTACGDCAYELTSMRKLGQQETCLYHYYWILKQTMCCVNEFSCKLFVLHSKLIGKNAVCIRRNGKLLICHVMKRLLYAENDICRYKTHVLNVIYLQLSAISWKPTYALRTDTTFLNGFHSRTIIRTFSVQVKIVL